MSEPVVTAGDTGPAADEAGLKIDSGLKIDAGLRVDAEPGAHSALPAPPAAGSEPNGWFAGPVTDPDRFELLGPGLAGGEGNTWKARYKGELTEPLTLAVKEIRRPQHAPPRWPAESDLRRWEDQRALLQYMRIDHLVTVIDVFVGAPPHLPGPLPGPGPRRPPGTPYVVMEWVPGPTLADELSGRPATAGDLDQRLTHVQHIAEALHSLHSRTVSAGNPTLHRDVKPTNCILDPRRGVVLVDVGTMRRMDDGYDSEGLHTPAYTAPEVLANPQAARAVASDLYSLGALAYFCVLGEDPPNSGLPEAENLIRARLLAATQAAGVADPEGFADHLGLMLQTEPGQRPADPMSWARRLRSRAAIRPRRRRSARLRIWVPALVVVAGVLAFIVFPTPGGATGTQSPGTQSPGQALAGPYGPPPGAPPPNHPLDPDSGIPSGTALRTRLATITTPPDRSAMPLCAPIQGTSQLPAGQTLLLSVENLSAGDRVKHLHTVEGWQQPSTLHRWHGTVFLGLPGDPPGTRYQIDVFVVPLASTEKQFPGATGGNWGPQLPAGSRLGASVFVTRASQPAGTSAPSCPG